MKALRPRDKTKELAADFSCKARTELERVWDAVRNRDSLYVGSDELSRGNLDKKF
jgi:hypothetical protein